MIKVTSDKFNGIYPKLIGCSIEQEGNVKAAHFSPYSLGVSNGKFPMSLGLFNIDSRGTLV